MAKKPTIEELTVVGTREMLKLALKIAFNDRIDYEVEKTETYKESIRSTINEWKEAHGALRQANSRG